MLVINVPDIEFFDDDKQEFGNIKATAIQLEHSLVSISKWEAVWEKPYITNEKKTAAEIVDYIRCMTMTQNVDPAFYGNIPSDVYLRIMSYIDDKMTATWFNEEKKSSNRDIVTSEIIYYWMISLNIPMECQKWHLNRLLTLIKVCNIKNAPDKKMSKKETIAKHRSLNNARRKRLNSKG